MNEVFWVTDNNARAFNEAVKLTRWFFEDYAQPPSLSLNFERNTGLQHLVKQCVNLLAQFRRSNNHSHASGMYVRVHGIVRTFAIAWAAV